MAKAKKAKRPEETPAAEPAVEQPEPAAEAAPAPEPKPDPEDTWAVDKLSQINRAGREAARAQTRWLRAKEKASAFKKDYEACLARVQQLAATADQKPFKLGEDPDAVDLDEPEPVTATAVGPADDDSWRSVTLDKLDLPASVRTKLGEADILTLGDLSDWSRPRPEGKGGRLTDVKGIGEAAATAVDDALMKFWEGWNARRLEAADAEADAAGPAEGPEPNLGPADPWQGEEPEAEP